MGRNSIVVYHKSCPNFKRTTCLFQVTYPDQSLPEVLNPARLKYTQVWPSLVASFHETPRDHVVMVICHKSRTLPCLAARPLRGRYALGCSFMCTIHRDSPSYLIVCPGLPRSRPFHSRSQISPTRRSVIAQTSVENLIMIGKPSVSLLACPAALPQRLDFVRLESNSVTSTDVPRYLVA